MPLAITMETLTPEFVVRIAKSLAEGGGLSLLELSSTMPEPVSATVREIDIHFDPLTNRFITKFTKANYHVNVTSYGGIAGVVSRLAHNNLPMTDDAAPKPPFTNQLSLQNKIYCYVVFKLTGKNWQFSYNEDPFSVALQSTVPEIYFSPRKVDQQGNILARGTDQDNCKIAYFIADGAVAYDVDPQYVDPFNLHLDVMDTDSAGQPSRIPIIIDPDVRYPGGSGVDP